MARWTAAWHTVHRGWDAVRDGGENDRVAIGEPHDQAKAATHGFENRSITLGADGHLVGQPVVEFRAPPARVLLLVRHF